MRKDKIVTEVMGEENVLTPSDLYNHDFKRSTMGGYKVEEVDQFLERVADVMESLINQVRDLKEQTDDQREQLEEYRQMEKTLRNALMSSQKFSENILESARREADALVEEGRMKKAKAELEVARMPNKMAGEIEQLKRQRRQLRAEILSVVETHRRLLDSLLPEEALATQEGFLDVADAEALDSEDDVSEDDAAEAPDMETPSASPAVPGESLPDVAKTPVVDTPEATAAWLDALARKAQEPDAEDEEQPIDPAKDDTR